MTLQQFVNWFLSGFLVIGAYAIAHFLLGASDFAILVFCGALIWTELSSMANKKDKP